MQFLVDILPHIFADPDPGSQNLADTMDPDPKHCFLTKNSLDSPVSKNVLIKALETDA